ncbi:MAG: hypothetical protein G01um10148_577 [Parcubacteria group bacterium Gr01-1014_8]|nr:MAG: hypothetical protein G01um10148_577 [Parcubacteria group bacterium Gr01-1014_8]
MKTALRVGLLVAAGVLFFGSFAEADHAWAPYHWARTANPFTIQLGDNLTSAWDPYLVTAASDWSISSVLDVTIVASGKNPKTCRPTAGRGEVCNAKYGSNGWLGIAQIWIMGDHITQGVVKLNDTYFTRATYNTAAWKNLVMCQEVGHVFGLDHQDENMTNPNLDTCMDYTNNPESNQHPNAHDYEMLETIYAHLDPTTTLSQSAAAKAQAPESVDEVREWGREIRRSADGRASLFERDFGGQKVFTHVFWAEEDGRFTRER